MFTQCEHCQAIFDITMREVTAAKGQVRCGECHGLFDASKTLSTSQQSRFITVDINNTEDDHLVAIKKRSNESLTTTELQTIKALDNWQTESKDTKTSEAPKQASFQEKQPHNTIENRKSFKKSQATTANKTAKKSSTQNRHKKPTNFSLKWGVIIASLLALLLLLQVVYNHRHHFFSEVVYAPDKIQMLNHNVFAHPIESGALLISATIENTASFDQPYPYLEVKLSNEKSKLVALRRFSPNEYLDNHSSKQLLPKNRPTSIKLKIKDPGNQATRFQFNFM